ncbi:MAG TPA: hypothetical protein VFQ13_06520 [Anaerolineales bacterium]|nr:hypothetical protein [Anaerolineales bacterium]
MKPLTYLLHGFVFAFGSAIIFYGTVVNINIFISPADIIPLVVFSVIAFFAFVLVAYLLTHSLDTAGLIASLFVLGFFYLWSVFLVVVIATLMGLVAVKVLFKRVKNADTHLMLNAVSIAVVGYYLFGFITMNSGTPWASAPKVIQPIDGVPVAIPSQAAPPDIYYIILDGYGRADMLQAIHGFDNSMFVDALEQRGFVVASDSQSNYARTPLSLSSSLNMQYLDTMSSAMGDSDLWWPVVDAMQHSEVRRILENRGYRTIFFANNGHYSEIRDGDFYEAPFPIQLDIFSGLFVSQTNLHLLAEIDQLGIAEASYDTHRRTILYTFERLPEVATIKGAKYVFAHVIAPHPPYVFDRVGNPLDPPYPYTLSVESRAGYIDQLQFINRLVLAAVDGILANSASPPIIVIQGDHGPGTQTDHNSLENSCLYERFSILNAYHLPGVEKASIPMDLTPVNSFRFIFNHYFHSDLELLPNRQYFSTSTHFYEFIDVSSKTQEMCNLNSSAK